ncbi:DUF3010 family protein [Prolixibacteraceae bacterium Z1-6]|uniref:DUF3010 family protein n=1 Tax=Draconibacterium aestuarii TaxID=2998507 RepID=A0A9X3F698_9BACT|nr:DUF3010 family protein [Prolixibacteraceae bacterium Z1-6]
MRTCGIEIVNDTALLLCIEKNENGNVEINRLSAKIKLEEPDNSVHVKEFAATIYACLDEINADAIAILKRQSKGQFSAGALSFKIESVIQCYPNKDVRIVAPATVKAFLRKNPIQIQAKYKYQENALNAAHFSMG